MAKTSESVSVLIRSGLWQIVTLKLLPFLLLVELTRSAWRWISEQLGDD